MSRTHSSFHPSPAAMGATTPTILLPMTKGTLGFCGVDAVAGEVFHAVGTVGEEGRGAMLDRAYEAGRRF